MGTEYMSKIIAHVSNIQSVDNLNIVNFKCENTTLTMMSLELSKRVGMGTKVLLSVKPTATAIGKNIKGELSYSNQLNVKILSLEIGELLCALKLKFHDFILESIITTSSQKRMNLQVNDEVVALIKSTDLSIEQVL